MAPAAFDAVHEDYGGVIDEVGGRSVVRRYRRPARTHRAVRNGVGTIEFPYDVLRVTGDRRLEALDGALTNRVPRSEGAGRYAFYLDGDGHIAADCYAYTAGERVLVFVTPGKGARLEATLAGETAVTADLAADLTVFGIHGPQATEKVASVLNRTGTPTDRLSFVRGRIADVGVTVLRTDAPAGEPGYEVVCDAEHRRTLFDTLLNRGLNAVPFGWATWLGLTLEAGTPVCPPDLAGRSPATARVTAAYPDGSPPTAGPDRLVGVSVASADGVEAGAAVRDGDGQTVGTVTRIADSPLLERRIGFAVVPETIPERFRIETAEGTVTAAAASLPFYEGGERSARCPGDAA